MKIVSLAAIAVALLLFSSPITRAQSTPPPAQAGTFEYKVEEYIRKSGFEFKKVKANSWYLLTPGKEMSQMRVILGAGPGSIAMGAVVLPKRDLKPTTEALQQLLKLSYELNYVRVCIDPDDDLIIMAQLKGPWLDDVEFKNTVNLVIAAADRAYAVMRPYLNSQQ